MNPIASKSLLALAVFGTVLLAGCVSTGQGTVKTDIVGTNQTQASPSATTSTNTGGSGSATLTFTCTETRGAGTQDVKVTFSNPGTTVSEKTCTTVKLVKGGGQVQSTQTVCAEAVAAGQSTIQTVHFIISPYTQYSIECTAS